MGATQAAAAGAAMKRISSKGTFALKKLTPLFFFGFLAFFVGMALANGAMRKTPLLAVPLLAVPCVMAAIGYQWWTKMQELADEVDDGGDFLVVRKGQEEDTVMLSNINNVRFTTMRNGSQARITLLLDSPGRFGRQITFVPPARLYIGTRRDPIADDLLARAMKARSAHGA